MKTQQLLIILLALVLAACAPAQTTPAINLTEVQNTAIAAAWTDVALTQTATPTATPEAMPSIVLPAPSPLPTKTPYTFSITPDAIQVERWQEY